MLSCLSVRLFLLSLPYMVYGDSGKVAAMIVLAGLKAA